MHAAFWETEPPGGDAGRLVSWADPMFGAMLTQLVTSGVAALRQRYEGRVATGVLDAIERRRPTGPRCCCRCAEGPQTFVHNDFRLDNIFFEADGSRSSSTGSWRVGAGARRTWPTCCREAWPPTRCAMLGVARPRYHARLSRAASAATTSTSAASTTARACSTRVAPGIAMLGQMQLAGGDDRGLADTLVLRTLTHAAELDAFATL